MSIKIENKFEEVAGPANLYRAARVTLLNGLRFTPGGAAWKMEQEYHLMKLRRKLLSRSYRHGSYHCFKIYDPKERYILAAPIADRVVHHALHDVIEPVVDHKFIFHSYACRRGKGHHRAVKTARSFLQANEYFIHLDVRKFFYSIHRPTLLEIVRRAIRDEGIDWLLTEIINSSDRQPYAEELRSPEQLCLFEPVLPDIPLISDSVRGLPVGNLTSQLLANWYLNELDQFVKHKLKHRYYLRYMDDFALFSNNREQLKNMESEIRAFSRDKLKLILRPSGGPARHNRGLGFLGFRIFRSHMRLRSAAAARFRKKLKKLAETCDCRTLEGFRELWRSCQSWDAHAAHGDTYRLRKNIFCEYPAAGYMFGNKFNLREMEARLL